MIGQILEYNTVVTKAEFLFMIQSVNLPPSAHTITFSAHCSTLHPLQPKAAHPVHTLQQPLHLECTLQPCTAICSQSSVHTAAMYTHVQLSAANLQCTLQPTAAIYNHLHCSYSIQCTLQLYYPVHTTAILSSAHCSYSIQCTLQLFYPEHTTAILSSAHCSYTIQCTLQLFYPVHPAAILSSAHCSYSIQCTLQLFYPVHTAATLSIQYIQCTFESPQGKPIPLLAYLQSNQQTLMVDCSSP